MWLKGKLLRTVSLRQYVLAIAVASASVWWVSAECRAQEANSAALTVTSHTMVGARTGIAPHLVIGMLEPGETLSYGSAQLPGDKAADPSAQHVVAGPSGAAAALRRTTYGPAQTARLLLAKQAFTGLAGVKGYSFSDNSPAPESFMHEYEANRFATEQVLAGNEGLTQDTGSAPVPLVQLQVSGWSLPVMLAGAAGPR